MQSRQSATYPTTRDTYSLFPKWLPVLSPLEPVTDGDERVLDAPVLQLGEDLQPEPGALGVVTDQMPRVFHSPFVVTPMTGAERVVRTCPSRTKAGDHWGTSHEVGDDEEDRVERGQWTGRPVGQLAGDLLK